MRALSGASIARIGLAFDAPYRDDQLHSVDKRDAVGSQLSHLAVELGIARRLARRAAPVPDMLALLRPVGEVRRPGHRSHRCTLRFMLIDPARSAAADQRWGKAA